MTNLLQKIARFRMEWISANGRGLVGRYFISRSMVIAGKHPWRIIFEHIFVILHTTATLYNERV